MRFAHILARVTGTPWFITNDALENIAALLEVRINGRMIDGTTPDAPPPPPAAPKGTALIPVGGLIGKRLSSLEMVCGGVDVDWMRAAFDKANAAADVDRIVLHIHSPGGTVAGVPELARHIYDTKAKPVVAVSDTVMGSAAYYLGSAADEIAVTPTAVVGSIGVVLQVRETLTPTAVDGRTRLRVFRSGNDKMAGTDGPLSEAQAAALQERVDMLGEMFRSDVRKARPTVAADSMTGLSWFGEEAVRRGLADRLVADLSEVLSR
jgi:ClpP class serine protease